MCSYTFSLDTATVLQYAAVVYFFGIFHKYCPILAQNSPITIFNPFDAIFNEKNNVQHFRQYAAIMQQYTAAVIFMGIFDNN